MTIRFATISDKDAVLSLLDELIKQANLKSGSPLTPTEKIAIRRNQYTELLQRDDVKIFVAEDEGKLVGIADLFIIPIMRRGYYSGHIEDFVITWKMRGKGIGSKLLTAVKSYCKKNSIKVFKLTTAVEFEEAQKFYEKNGGKFTEKMYRFDL